MLEPIYSTIRQVPTRTKSVVSTGAGEELAETELVRDWKSLGRVLCPVLMRLGFHISADVVLFTKVCSFAILHLSRQDQIFSLLQVSRVLKEYMKTSTAVGSDIPKEEADAVSKAIITKVLLPGLALAGCNPALSYEVRIWTHILGEPLEFH